MTRAIALAALLALAPWAAGQQQPPAGGGQQQPPKPDEKKKKPDAAKPCDNKKIEEGLFCDSCQNNLKPDELSGKNCKVCGKEPKKIQYCVKRGYLSTCGKEECMKMSTAKGGQCKCKKVREESTEKCKIMYVCDGCGASAYVKDEIKHNEETHKDETKKKGERRTCENSGLGLHVGK